MAAGGRSNAEEARESQIRFPRAVPRPLGAEDRQAADLEAGRTAPAPVGAGAWALEEAESEDLEDARLDEIHRQLRFSMNRGRWQQALLIFSEARRSVQWPDPDVYQSVLRAYESSRSWEEALALLAEIWEKGYEQVHAYHFNSVMVACKRSGRWERVLALLHHMRTFGPVPDTSVYNTAIGACTVGLTDESRWQHSLLLMEQMMKPEIGASERSGAVPSTRTFGAVIAACEKGFQWERCLAVFNRMAEVGVRPTDACIHSALRSCEKCGKWEEALSICCQASLERSSLILPFNALVGSFMSAGEDWRVPAEVFVELGGQAPEVLDVVLRDGWTCERMWSIPMSQRLKSFLSERSTRLELRDPGTTEFEMCRFSELAGPSIQVMGRLRRYDHLTAAHVDTWMRRVQRPLERKLRELYKAGECRRRSEAPSSPSPILGGVNDLATWAEGSLRQLGLLGRRPGEEVQTARTVQRRSSWWLIHTWGENPETALITVVSTYRISVGSGEGSVMRSPGTVTMQRRMPFTDSLMIPIDMFRDRVQHRGTHAERQALLRISARIFQRARLLPEGELAARGELWLHVNHTPCLSCTGVISQFQGLFPTISVTVSFDVWWGLRPRLQNPWQAQRFAPLDHRAEEVCFAKEGVGAWQS